MVSAIWCHWTMNSLINFVISQVTCAGDDLRFYVLVFSLWCKTYLCERLTVICCIFPLFFCLFVVCSQAGTGAKAKNLFNLNKEYKGVSWRYDMPPMLMRFTLTVTFYEPRWCVLALCCSIGGDETLETVTTIPSEFILDTCLANNSFSESLYLTGVSNLSNIMMEMSAEEVYF